LLEQGSHWRWFGFIGRAKVTGQDHTEAALGFDQEEREGTVTINSPPPSLGLFGRVRGFVGTVIGLVVSFVENKAGLSISGRSGATGGNTSDGIAGATLAAFIPGRAGTGLVRGGKLITTVSDMSAAKAGSGKMEHAIGAKGSLLPSLGADNTGI